MKRSISRLDFSEYAVQARENSAFVKLHVEHISAHKPTERPELYASFEK